MLIIGCDFHTRYQQIAMSREETGESLVKRARRPAHSLSVVGEALSENLGSHAAERDLRQLLWRRHKLVCLRTMLGNQLHFLAMSQGLCRKQNLFTKKGPAELASLALGPWASRRRAELLQLLGQLDPPIAELDRAVLKEAHRREDAVRLMTHPGIRPVNALAFVLTIGSVTRFPCSREIASYLGLNPTEESIGGRRRLGSISKQGNTMAHWLLVEAAQQAMRFDAALRRQDYLRLKFRRGHAVARQPGGHPGGRKSIARLIGRLAPAGDRGF
jgi:transposase